MPYDNNKADEQAKKHGYKNAHDLKKDYVGDSGSSYDIKHDTSTGDIYLESKNGKVVIPTGLKNIP